MGPAYLLDVVGITRIAQAVMAAGTTTDAKEYRDAIDALFDASRLGKKRSGLLAL
ncbi:hypothetical protein KCP77_01025 [Salmonella enterica subsp. enterica]|nr:hypothetical protein KCP77_01025 [Salmonella enterica subsp. enterica]